MSVQGRIPVIEVAVRHGGGHALACGCKVTSWDEVDQIITELHELV